jgi:hypothetical protein
MKNSTYKLQISWRINSVINRKVLRPWSPTLPSLQIVSELILNFTRFLRARGGGGIIKQRKLCT